ncbi:amidase signature domain-containing protein [Aspergillus lucknowensis]|uniref:amidase n=1 Tax=Aspergillus lucknowensis TaxID=176173 RepID=A0ABR4LN33_9EURO
MDITPRNPENREPISLSTQSKMTEAWKAKATAKREALSSLIPPEWRLPTPVPPPSELPNVTREIRRYLSPQEISITESSAVEIVTKTSTGQWKCEAVTRAFCHRAALAHQMINCLHEIFFDAAIDSARSLDEYYGNHRKPRGPLHGLPISLKDTIHVEGVQTSMGIVGWLDTVEGQSRGPHPEHTKRGYSSLIVQNLQGLGAIPYVKTSVPQGSFSGETTNHIIGHTPNPANRNLVVGGSSGGEGGLLALYGSPLGLGTDIGGSIRVPAAFNECFGLKPSTGRLPFQGIASVVDGEAAIPFVVGPMAHSAGDLVFCVRALLAVEPWRGDPLVLELPWRDEVFESTKRIFRGLEPAARLAFGVMVSDGVVNPQPPVTRALGEVVQLLRALGHTVIEWKPPSHAEALKLWRENCVIDGGTKFHNALSLSSEPATPTVFGNRARAPVDGSEVMARTVALREYRKAYLDYWESTADETGTGRAVDALIAPVHHGPPPAKGKVRYMGYTCAFNVLDYSASVIPVTRARKDVDVYTEGYSALNPMDKMAYEDYDPGLLDGAPVGVQIVGRRLQEETVLALAEEISSAMEKGDPSRL